MSVLDSTSPWICMTSCGNFGMPMSVCVDGKTQERASFPRSCSSTLASAAWSSLRWLQPCNPRRQEAASASLTAQSPRELLLQHALHRVVLLVSLKSSTAIDVMASQCNGITTPPAKPGRLPRTGQRPSNTP